MKSWALPLAVTLGSALVAPLAGVSPRDLHGAIYLLLAGFLALDFARARWSRVEEQSRRVGPFLFLALSLMAVRGALRELPHDDYFTMGGIVPWSDASGYLRGARALVEFGRADVWAARRMVAVLHYAVLLFFSGQNLGLTLWLVGILCALALTLATHEILSRCGFAGAFVFWLMLATLFEGTAGRVMTESIGFLFGTLAFVFLVRGLEDRKQALAGLFLMQIAESARPGAMFVVPILAAFYLYHFREERLRRTVEVVGTLVAGLAVTFFIQRTLTSGVGQASFAYTLYGVAKGGIGWRGVLREHPELMQLADGPRTEAIYRLATQAIRDQPGRFVGTLWHTLMTQLRSPFAYFYNLGLPFPYELLFVPVVLGLIRQKLLPFLLPCLFGVWLSAPFLVDGGPRVFAATLWVPAALAACGFSLVNPKPIEVAFFRPLSYALAGVLGAILIVAPLGFLIRHMFTPPAAVEGVMQIRVRPGSGFTVGTEISPAAIPQSPGLRELRAVTHLHPGNYLTSALDRTRPEADQPMYFLFDKPPPFGDLTVKTTVLEAAAFGHTLYAAEVVAPR